jgi:hypothetical protein
LQQLATALQFEKSTRVYKRSSKNQSKTDAHLLAAAKHRLLVLRTARLTGNALEADMLLLLLRWEQ